MGKWKVLKAQMRIRLPHVEEERTGSLLKTGGQPCVHDPREVRWQAQRALKKETALLPNVQTTLAGKEKLAGARQPNRQEHTTQPLTVGQLAAQDWDSQRGWLR